MSKDDFITLEDGYVYFYPVHRKGAISASELRVLADILDAKNVEWHKQVCEGVH